MASKKPTLQELMSDDDICFGDKVILRNKHVGIVEYIGRPTFGKQTSNDIYYGITLNLPKGQHNGKVRGIKYWECKPNHGTFVKRDAIKEILTKKQGDRFTINTIVKINKIKCKNYNKNGVIRFIGYVKELKHNMVMYGIETLDDIGENNGDYNGNYYFICPLSHGIFLKENELIYLDNNIPIQKQYVSKRKYKHQKTMSKQLNLFNLNLNDLTDDDGDISDTNSISSNNNNNNSTKLIRHKSSNSHDSDSDEDEDQVFLSMEEIEMKFKPNNNKTKRMSFARILTDC